MQKYIFTFRDKELPNDRELRSSLSRIYGLGFTKSFILTSKLGFPYPYFACNISEYYYFIIISLLNRYLISEVKAKRFVELKIKNLISINSYKGKRHYLALPVRGQRSKTNGRTIKKLKIISK